MANVPMNALTRHLEGKVGEMVFRTVDGSKLARNSSIVDADARSSSMLRAISSPLRSRKGTMSSSSAQFAAAAGGTRSARMSA